MDHTPLQNALLLYWLSPHLLEIAEGLLATAGVLCAIALRRRTRLVNAGTLLLMSLGLALDGFAPSLAASPGLMNGLSAAAVIFFFWGVIRGVLELIFSPRGRVHYSTILRDLMMVLAWAFVVAVVLNTTLGFDITKIFVSSALIAGAIGLGLQETLRNLFSGLMFQVARPFVPGDWVRFQSHVGRVSGTSWAATEIVTRSNERVKIPNSMLITQPLMNYAAAAVADEITIAISYDDAPGRVKEAVLNVVRDIPHVLADPPPQVYAWEYGDYAIKYRVKYWLGDYTVQETVRDTLCSSLWYALRRHAIDIPYPTQTLQMQRRPVRPGGDARFEKEMMSDLRRVDWLRGLSDEELRMLLPHVNVHQFGVGEMLVREGDPGDSFFIIRHGTVEVTGKAQDGAIRHIADISPESPSPFFGESALMAGEPRNATIRARTEVEVLEMSRQGFGQLFKEHPGLAEPIAEIIEGRTQQRVGLLAEARRGDGTRKVGSRLLAKMREIFDFPATPRS
jgi:small-conductance mechanosensitive channel/CRP-like cAMP-binding protein